MYRSFVEMFLLKRIWIGRDSQDWIETVVFYTYGTYLGYLLCLLPYFFVFFLIFWIKTGFNGFFYVEVNVVVPGNISLGSGCVILNQVSGSGPGGLLICGSTGS
jgi:hypothetical protein